MLGLGFKVRIGVGLGFWVSLREMVLWEGDKLSYIFTAQCKSRDCQFQCVVKADCDRLGAVTAVETLKCLQLCLPCVSVRAGKRLAL